MKLKDKFILKLKDYLFNNKDYLYFNIKDYKIITDESYLLLDKPETMKIHKNNIENIITTEIIEESSDYEILDNFGFNDINLNISLYKNNTCLIDNSYLLLNYNKKYGLVGKNGVGKTSLLKEIRKHSYNIDKRISIHSIKQEFNSNLTLQEYFDKKLDYKIISSLGFTDLSIKISDLSGGWRMRAQLALSLSICPDLLLLDEPTNYLDLKSISYLENKIKELNTVIIVSHDRTFLDNTCDNIIYLNNTKLNIYKGNYTTFNNTLISNYNLNIKLYEKQQQEIFHIQEFINKFRSNAKKASLVQSRIKYLQKINLIDKPNLIVKSSYKFNSSILKGELLNIKNLSFKYNKPLLNNINLRVTNKSRIVIVGSNGEGKSTLLKLMAKKINSNIEFNEHIKIGYFDQHHSFNKNIFELFNCDNDKIYYYLKSFGLNIKNGDPNLLSGGQKSKLNFSILSSLNPNLLILDEPTNHLDINTIDALVDGLNSFEGGIVCVSHDLSFVKQIFNEIYILKETKLYKYNKSIEDYKKDH